MIRVVMLGRTGNNLFQYALGRVLAKKHDVALLMDASWFNAEGWHAVSCLRRIPGQPEIRRRLSIGSRVLRKLSGRHYWEARGVPVLKEEHGHGGYDPRFLDAPADCVLFGYFQSPKYFESIECELREELDLASLPWREETHSTVRDLTEVESVAVHVRRTDFLGRQEFDICDLDYYKSAMDRMRNELDAPRFFVFSDDPDWCRAELVGEDVEVMNVAGSNADPLHDLFLMSRARHHVIANSSYSWWAAWLGKSSGQRVIAPDRWFGGGIETPMDDRLPAHWMRIPVGA